MLSSSAFDHNKSSISHHDADMCVVRSAFSHCALVKNPNNDTRSHVLVCAIGNVGDGTMMVVWFHLISRCQGNALRSLSIQALEQYWYNID